MSPQLLTPGGVRTPAVRILFLILITQDGLKRPAMQVKRHHISRRKRVPRQGREEQLVDDLAPCGADGSSGAGRRMRGDDHACARPRRAQKQIRAIKESTAGSGFGVRDLLVKWLGQAGLHLRQIEQTVVLAPHHIGQSSQIGDDGSIAILTIQTHESLAEAEQAALAYTR